MSDTSFTELQHPSDLTYRMNRANMVRELCKMSVTQLDAQISYLAKQPAPRDESRELTKRIMGEMYTAPYTPAALKGILDSTGGTTGK